MRKNFVRFGRVLKYITNSCQRQTLWEKAIDAQGAGATVVSPDWLTGLQRNWGGSADVPVAGKQFGGKEEE